MGPNTRPVNITMVDNHPVIECSVIKPPFEKQTINCVLFKWGFSYQTGIQPPFEL